MDGSRPVDDAASRMPVEVPKGGEGGATATDAAAAAAAATDEGKIKEAGTFFHPGLGQTFATQAEAKAAWKASKAVTVEPPRAGMFTTRSADAQERMEKFGESLGSVKSEISHEDSKPIQMLSPSLMNSALNEAGTVLRLYDSLDGHFDKETSDKLETLRRFHGNDSRDGDEAYKAMRWLTSNEGQDSAYRSNGKKLGSSARNDKKFGELRQTFALYERIDANKK